MDGICERSAPFDSALSWIVVPVLLLCTGCQFSRTVQMIESPTIHDVVFVEGAVERPGAQRIGKVATLSQVLMRSGLRTEIKLTAEEDRTDLDINDTASGSEDRPRRGRRIEGMFENDDGLDPEVSGSDVTDEVTDAAGPEGALAGAHAPPITGTPNSSQPTLKTSPFLVGIRRHLQFDVYYFPLASVERNQLIGSIHVFPGDTVSVRSVTETGLDKALLNSVGVPDMKTVADNGQYLFFLNGEEIRTETLQTFADVNNSSGLAASANVLWLVRHPPGRMIREHFIHILGSQDDLTTWMTLNEPVVVNDQLNFTSLEAVPVIASHLIASPRAADFLINQQKVAKTTTVTSHDVLVDWEKLHRMKPRWLRHEGLANRTVTRQIEIEPEALEIDSQFRQLQELPMTPDVCWP